jgi:hypothetical protein
VSRPERGGDAHGLAPFTAVRPLTNTQLIAAKLKASMRSTLATWVLVLIAIPIALRWSGTSSAVTDVAHHFAEALGAPRAIALGLLFLMALVLSTWKQLVQSLYVDMTGNEKLVKANVFVWLVLLAVGFPMLLWIRDKTSVIALLWNGFPFIVGVLVVIKTLMAAWTIVRLDERRLVTDRGLLIIAACWAASVFALYGVLVLIFPEMFPRYLLALIAILVIPLVRVAAIPLALARNRHR